MPQPYIAQPQHAPLYTWCHVQDIDQRLTRDVERLCSDLTALIPSMVKPVVDLAWFSAQLWRLLGAKGTGVLYLYAVAGFAVLRMVTPDFGKLAQQVPLPACQLLDS